MRTFVKCIDPRVKLAYWLSLVITGLLLPAGWPNVIFVTILVCFVASFIGCFMDIFRFACRLVLPTMIMLFILYSFLVPGPTKNDTYIVHQNVIMYGLIKSFEIGVRLLAIGISTIAFSFSTSQFQMAQALRAIRLPPSLVAIFISSFGIYTLVKRKIRQILDAQRSRGLSREGILIKRIQMYMPILRPLFFGLIMGAIERSALWHSRNYFSAIKEPPVLWKAKNSILILVAIMLPLIGGAVRWLR